MPYRSARSDARDLTNPAMLGFAQLASAFGRNAGSLWNPPLSMARDIQERNLGLLRQAQTQVTIARQWTEMSLHLLRQVEAQSAFAREAQETGLRWLDRVEEGTAISSDLADRLGSAGSIQEIAATWLDWANAVGTAASRNAAAAMDDVQSLMAIGHRALPRA
jgi:hypothetical protein